MPDPTLTQPGFFGKIPAAGDFVTRRLPAAFLRFWDRWVARHLVPRLVRGVAWPRPALRFLLGAERGGPMAGVVLPSADRAGRCYPLTLAARPPAAATGIAVAAQSWFAALEAIGAAGIRDRIDADRLAERLAGLPFPDMAPAGATDTRLLLWSDPAEACDTDPEAPDPMLDRLFATKRDAD